MGKKCLSKLPSEQIQAVMMQILDGDDGIDSSVDIEVGHWAWLADEAFVRQDLNTLKRLSQVEKRKPFQKHLKRIHHKLRSQGVKVDRARTAVSFKPEVTFEGRVTLATLQGEMASCVFRQPPGELGHVLMMRDLKSLQLDIAVMSRGEASKTFRDVVQTDADGVEWFKIPSDYAAHLMFDFLRRYNCLDVQANTSIADLLIALGKLPDSGAEHPVQHRLRERGIQVPLSVGTSGDLMEDPFFSMLWPDQDWVSRCRDRLEGVAQSPLTLSHGQKIERLKAEADRVLGEMIADCGLRNLSE